MNKIILFLCISISYLFSSINENKIDLFFGNGIDTDYRTAKLITKKLNEILLGKNLALRDTYFNKDSLNRYSFNTNLAYNNTLGFIMDGIEASLQKDLTFGCFLTTNSDTELIDKVVLSTLSQEEKRNLIINIVNNESICVILNEIKSYDINKQLLEYKNSLNKGHRVMAVVHSQGNLFLNEVGKRLENWEKDYIEGYGIGTPARQVFKQIENYEPNLNDYITVGSDPMRILGLKSNFEFTSEDITKYNISTNSAEGHYIDNYLRIPSLRDIIIEGIESKSKKLLNLPSLFKFTKSNNYCSFLNLEHKYKEESYLGLIFNENGKVNSVGEYVVMNNNFLKGFTELPNDPINCYTDLKSIDFIKRNNTDINLDISIYNITNKGYIISGEINNYESSEQPRHE